METYNEYNDDPKIWQNYRKKDSKECCGTCEHFTAKSVEDPDEYSINHSRKKKSICGLGDFKVSKNGVCDLYEMVE